MMKRILAGIALALLMAGALGVADALADCPQFFVGGRAPTVAPAMTGEAPGPLTDICFPGYGLEEAGLWRQPLWSAEHLLATNLPPKGTDRANPFHVEASLPSDQRAELSDYVACSKTHDRGHATPVGDFLAKLLRDATFSLANMMAQTKVDNEQAWNHIENGVRAAVKREGEAWIVTGPHVPQGAPHICGRLPEPDFIWKAVYFPKSGIIGAYWSANDASNSPPAMITVAELTLRTGVDPYPGLPDAKRAEVHTLPAPQAGGS
jgi:endonuclease G